MAEKKQDARIRYTKMVIRSSLIQLLREKPIAKITVTEICERAGINRATFYAHYADPTELLHSIQTSLIEDVSRWIHPALTAVGNDLRNVLTCLMEYIRENAEVCSVLLSDTSDTSFQSLVVSMIEKQFIATWTATRDISREDAEYLYAFVAIGSFGLIRKWLADGMKKPVEEMAEIIVRLSNSGYSGV